MHKTFQTINGKGLDRSSYPMKLWEKAKKYGTWNPNDIDFSQDAEDWKKLDEVEKDYILRLVASFQAGEEAVTLDLLPLIMAIAKDGRLEEEMFLTSFLWEEAKHVDGFNRFVSTVLGEEDVNLEYLMVDAYKEIFYKILPNTMNALLTDPSPINLAKASVTYNMIVEGVLAETGYFSFHATLEKQGIMPGMLEFTAKLKQDESRHIAYGIFLISRLVAEHGEPVWNAVQEQMNMLMVPTLQIIDEAYNIYEVMPFGLNVQMFNDYAMDQFQKRFARIEKATRQSVAEVMELTDEIV